MDIIAFARLEIRAPFSFSSCGGLFLCALMIRVQIQNSFAGFAPFSGRPWPKLAAYNNQEI